jgi:purine-binding chemotaxis protein CheW
MELQLVIFELGEENYGVNISAVESIIKMLPITRVPHAPGFVEGIINLRGAVLPVIDLRKRFDLPAAGHDRDTRIVVTSLAEAKIGMVVDSVSEVLTIQEAMIEPTPAIVSTDHTEFLQGIVKIGERLVILLNLDRVLSDREQENLLVLPEAV